MFAILAVLFWIYFMYLWRTWEANKRDHNALTAADLEGDFGYGEDDDGDLEARDMMNSTLLNSRRKSVSFTVARLNRDASGEASSLTIDLCTRSVPIAAGGGSIGGGSGGSRSGSRTGSSCTIVGPSDSQLLKATSSPTPSAPADWRRSSMDAQQPSRRLSLAPEDALLHHSYSLYSPSASAARAKFLRRESEGSARSDRSTQSLYRKSRRRQQRRRSQQQQQQQAQQEQEEQEQLVQQEQQQEQQQFETMETAI